MRRSSVPVRPLAFLALCIALAGCAGYRALPLAERPALAPNLAALDRLRPGAPPIPADRPLSPDQVAVLAVLNSPDLRALAAQRGVAAAQVINAGLLPDPVLSGSYGVLLAGPAVADAIGATLTGDITALVTLSARRHAAREAALQVDAATIWQEWQTISRAETLSIDIIEQGRLLRLADRTLALLRRRLQLTANAVAQGNATLQAEAPDIAAVTSLETQRYASVLLQEQRWQNLDALLGLEPQVRPLLATTLRIPPLDPARAARLLATLPQRRPDLIALQLGYEAQEARLRAAVLAQFPPLMLGPNYGNDVSRVQTLGPSVSLGLPLFNRNRGAIAIQRATRMQLHTEYAARLAAAAGGARALLANVHLVKAQLRAARAGLARAQSLAGSAESGLRSGNLDELTYVQLITAALGKERQVIGLEQQVLDDRVALATLLGAGLPPVRLMPPKEPGWL